MLENKMIKWYFNSNSKKKKFIAKIYAGIFGFSPSKVMLLSFEIEKQKTKR